jgi:Tfp pilus assembly protein PilF
MLPVSDGTMGRRQEEMSSSVIEWIDISNSPVSSGQYRRQKARLERLLAKEPKIEHYLELAQLEARTEHWDEAQKAIRSALELQPDCLGAELFLARLLEKRQEISSAKEYYQELIQKYPEQSEVYREYGRFFLLHNITNPPVQSVLFKSLEINPKDALAHLWLARFYLQKNKKAQAKLHLEIALRCADGYPAFYSQSASIFMKLGDHQEAAKLWKNALKRDPRNKWYKKQYKEALKAGKEKRRFFIW